MKQEQKLFELIDNLSIGEIIFTFLLFFVFSFIANLLFHKLKSISK